MHTRTKTDTYAWSHTFTDTNAQAVSKFSTILINLNNALYICIQIESYTQIYTKHMKLHKHIHEHTHLKTVTFITGIIH